MRDESQRAVVGWAEYVDLPEWGIHGLRAKSDTGARSSSLHVENLVRLRGRRVSFDVVLGRKPQARRVRVTTRVSRESLVRSSNGDSERRPFVTTTIRIGPVERRIELNLVDRGRMIHRMLLGRSALAGLLVDVHHRYLLGPRKRRSPPVER
jgi:hypothetical protein